MGRNARRRVLRKAEIKLQRPVPPRPSNPVLILWGIPGAGKSAVARWLRDERGYEYVDTDSATMHGVITDLQSAWMGVLNGRVSPAAFVQMAAGRRSPVVIEYGLWARPPQIELLRQLRAAGAQAWWFDGDRAAAKESWRQENVRASRPFPDIAWDNVVAEIERNWSALIEFFGQRIVRTVEAGPIHPSAAATFKAMETIEAAGAVARGVTAARP